MFINRATFSACFQGEFQRVFFALSVSSTIYSMSSSSSEDNEFDLDVPVVPGLFTPPINRNIDDVPIDSVFDDADRNEVLGHHHNSGDNSCNMVGHNEEEYEEGHGSRNDDDDRENIDHDDEEGNNDEDEECDDDEERSSRVPSAQTTFTRGRTSKGAPGSEVRVKSE